MDIEKLQYLSLVRKVALELENNLGTSTRELAEFLIDTADKSETLANFIKALAELDAGLTDAFASVLFNLVRRMKPKKQVAQKVRCHFNLHAVTAELCGVPSVVVSHFPHQTDISTMLASA